jgi:hypothetical protein
MPDMNSHGALPPCGESQKKAEVKSMHPRAGWAEEFREIAANGDDQMIGGDWPRTDFDLNEWKWEFSGEPPCEQ